MRLRHPLNAKRKPRCRNDGTLHKGTTFARQYGAKGSIITTHRNMIEDAMAQGRRLLAGRYCWSPMLRRLHASIEDGTYDRKQLLDKVIPIPGA